VHRLGLDDRHLPAGLRPERQDALDLAHHRVGERVVGLVDDDHVGDLHHAGLQGLDRVARARDQHEHDGVGVVDDVDLGLADADGLQEHVVLAGGVHQQRGLQRRLGEPAERPARGHRADVDPGIEEVVGQADAVAQQRAAAERRGRVDREHGDLAVLRALVRDQAPISVDLPAPGGPGEADHRGAAGARIDLAHERPAVGVVVLDQRDRARQRALVAREEALGERLAAIGHRSPQYDPSRWTRSWSGPRPRSAASRRR
jgi:hypothetical protein